MLLRLADCFAGYLNGVGANKAVTGQPACPGNGISHMIVSNRIVDKREITFSEVAQRAAQVRPQRDAVISPE